MCNGTCNIKIRISLKAVWGHSRMMVNFEVRIRVLEVDSMREVISWKKFLLGYSL